MKRGQLEQKLTEKFRNYESEVDLDLAWESLNAKREKPRRKRFFIFFFLFGLMLLSSGSNFYFHETQEESKLALESPSTEIQINDQQAVQSALSQERKIPEVF